MWEGQPVWCPQYPPAISHATGAGEAWPQPQLWFPRCCDGMQGTVVLPALQLGAGADVEEAKGAVPTPKSLCLRPPSSFGTFSEQICSPALLSCVTACGECSAHLAWGDGWCVGS